MRLDVKKTIDLSEDSFYLNKHEDPQGMTRATVTNLFKIDRVGRCNRGRLIEVYTVGWSLFIYNTYIETRNILKQFEAV